MNETPTSRKPRLSLTKSQLELPAAIDLLQLLQSITADGRLLNQEIEGLREWTVSHRNLELPAIGHLRDAIDKVLGDGVITPQERKWLQQQIEAVLPVDARDEAKAQRRAAAPGQRAEQKRRELAVAARNTPIAELDFMVAGCAHDDRPYVIDTAVREDLPVFLVREPGNRYSPNATLVCLSDGRNIGYVPEDLARELAPLLDRGVRHEMSIKKVLRGRRVPVPVVWGDLYDPMASAGVVAPRARQEGMPLALRLGITIVIILAAVLFGIALLSRL